MAGKSSPSKNAIGNNAVQVGHADDLSRVIAAFEATTLAAQDCVGMAKALIDCAKLFDTPNDAVVMAIEGLYESVQVFFRQYVPRSKVKQRLLDVSDSRDTDADYGIGVTAASCHEIAWKYGQSVISVFTKHRIVMHTEDGKVVVPTRKIAIPLELGGKKNPPNLLKDKWKVIRVALKKLPQIDPKFDVALDREQMRARQKLDDQQYNLMLVNPELGSQMQLKEKSKVKVPNRRGRPKGSVAPGNDPNADRRVFEAWKGGKGAFKSFEQFAGDLGMDRDEAWLAKERHRDRLRGKSGKKPAK